jgi:predicted amidohydrolase
MTIRLAQVKVTPVKGDLAANSAALQETLEKIAPHRPDVVITPECFLDGYVVTQPEMDLVTLTRHAIDIATSDYVKLAADWAQAHDCWFVLGCMRDAPEGVYNTALILNRRGELVGHYDKTHLQNHDLIFTPGQALPVFGGDWGRFGVLICADRRWPETVRTQALHGAEIILMPTYGMHGDKNQRMMQTRSYESEVFIAFTHPAQALVTDPTGAIVTNERDPSLSCAITDVDLSRVPEVRAGSSAHLCDRRPELYDL